ncbi:multidrug ABC transporter ATP-binding protein [Bacillus sp. J14TS2]|uniref:ABC transporter ATP-binding protein n=1 Tax=Bacillus sp. J14TS2 TaxID=2807188 RepID=UPI001AFD9219|nr:ABC transporter ATP-binding protein [Bacillus sp. J14TS2]GIN74540.1 multidrug ABC transporter ATP-binding protein [Bacillus sp. J14TS2]
MIFQLVKRVLDLSGKYKNRIMIAFLFSVFESIFQKLPLLFAFFAIVALMNGEMTATDSLLLFFALLLAASLQMLFHYMNDRLQSDAGYKIFAKLRITLADRFRKIPMGYYTEGNIGKISSVLSTDMLFVEENVMGKIANTFNYMLSTLILTIFIFILDYRLGLVAFVTLLLYYFFIEKLAKETIAEGVKRQNQSEQLTDEVLGFIEGLAVMKSFNKLGEGAAGLRNQFKESKNKAIELEEKVTRWIRKIYLLLAGSTSLIFILGLTLHRTGEMTTEYLIALLLFATSFFTPLKALSGEVAVLGIMNSCLDRVNELFEVKELSDAGTQGLPPLANKKEEVAFENVSFGYEEKLVLQDVSFTLYPNTMTALVGPSGSGKTTIANLVARFWDINGGNIKVRGVDIKEMSLETLMSSISMVFQTTYLFQDTIYNNIKLGNPNATEEEVMEAAKKARCYEFIEELPQGFETVIGEGGESLSGGQRQRISIARCILKDAPIVILDEATASIDADNEYYIQQAISELVRDKTLLVIAHRLNTIRAADHILVIDHGEVVEEGKHDELVEQKGLYSILYGKVNEVSHR